MLYWTIRTTILSTILILLVHHLINFFKSTLTVPKFKDLVNVPAQKYADMFDIINNPMPKNYGVSHDPSMKHNTSSSSDINSLPNYETTYNMAPTNETTKQVDNDNMKSELKDFLKKQLNGDKYNKIMDTSLETNFATI
jgi:hypothetical protein